MSNISSIKIIINNIYVSKKLFWLLVMLFKTKLEHLDSSNFSYFNYSSKKIKYIFTTFYCYFNIIFAMLVKAN